MLYKFKSKATADLIMLEPNGRQVLKILGKDDADSLKKGILQSHEMPAAIVALEAAIAQDEAAQQRRQKEAIDQGRTPEPAEGISLRQRVVPLIAMLRRCMQEEQEVVWGV
jgi:cyclopropane-fatty-acyl-phospholipid synthase